MSPRGWNLSAAIVLCMALPAQAQTKFQDLPIKDRHAVAQAVAEDAFEDAMACTMIAATVYAELSQETARKVSELSHRKCEKEWKDRLLLSTEAIILELEIDLGRQFKQHERPDLPIDRLYEGQTLDMIELSVVDWRARSVAEGRPIFAGLRAQFQQNHEAAKLRRGY